MRRMLLWITTCLLTIIGSVLPLSAHPRVSLTELNSPSRPIYLAPRPGAQLVNPATTIALRLGGALDPQSVSPDMFQVVGSRTGVHTGQTVVADDHMTAIFRPADPFAPAETVAVKVRSGLRTVPGAVLAAFDFSFTIAPAMPRNHAAQPSVERVMPQADSMQPERDMLAASSGSRRYLTLPEDFPVITTTVVTNRVDAGSLFVATFDFGARAKPSYLLILDNTGEPIYYHRLPQGAFATDFKKQPNGLLTYYDSQTNIFHALDDTYTEAVTYRAGNGYSTDLHELQLLPNGHALLMIYDPQPVDMSKVVDGGSPSATVIGLVIQELDSVGNVVFEWRSWDHFAITDTTERLDQVETIDYVHGNAIELDHDGTLLVSSRHLDEVTKINRLTGEVVWRLGGKRNQFTFVNDVPFVHQHDSRRLANGHLSLFDNRSFQSPAYSRALEYELDEHLKTITRVWQYRTVPDTYSGAMGSAQRLPNGNTLIGWGSAFTRLLTEVTPDGSTAFELATESLVSYRAFRLPWQGRPTTKPTLVVQYQAGSTKLAYSWNGATDVQEYQVYASMTSNLTAPVVTQQKTGFETTTTFLGDQTPFCFFRVVPFDAQGQALQSSDVVRNPAPACEQRIKYFPLIDTAGGIGLPNERRTTP